jgi:hypothetical protein
MAFFLELTIRQYLVHNHLVAGDPVGANQPAAIRRKMDGATPMVVLGLRRIGNDGLYFFQACLFNNKCINRTLHLIDRVSAVSLLVEHNMPGAIAR